MTLLKTALQQVSHGPKSLQAWLDQNPDAHTPQFLETVKEYALDAMHHGAPHSALAAYLLAGSVYLRNNDLDGVLSSQLNQAEVLFYMAQTTDAYEQAHQAALMVADRAIQKRDTTHAFWALGLAADAAFFGSEAAENPATRREWLQRALDTLLKIEPLNPDENETASWTRVVSCLVAIYQRTTQAEWGSGTSRDQVQAYLAGTAHPAIEAKLRQLAALAERLIPNGFSFDDPEKTAHVAEHLAELSRRYGNAASAGARLKKSFQSIKSEKWTE